MSTVLWLGLGYLAVIWLLARGINRHARKHPHGPHRPARRLVLHITAQE